MRFIYTFLFVLLLPSLSLANQDINICVVQDNAPFSFMDSDGKLKGFDLDILEKMQLPYTINLHLNDLASSFAALGSGNCDMILSNIAINENRQKWFLFSETHLNAGLHAVVLQDSPIEDISNLQYGIIGVLKGSAAEAYVFKHYKSSIIYALRDTESLINMLNEGIIEAIIDSLPSLQVLIKQKDNIRILEQNISEEHYAYVFAKQNEEMRNTVSNAIAKLKENKQINEVYAKWFGQELINTQQ